MDVHIAHSEFWGLAVIMIVIVSWVFYRYFAPKNWREWAGAGLVQMLWGGRRGNWHHRRWIEPMECPPWQSRMT
jgi:hypothetical protein